MSTITAAIQGRPMTGTNTGTGDAWRPKPFETRNFQHLAPDARQRHILAVLPLEAMTHEPLSPLDVAPGDWTDNYSTAIFDADKCSWYIPGAFV